MMRSAARAGGRDFTVDISSYESGRIVPFKDSEGRIHRSTQRLRAERKPAAAGVMWDKGRRNASPFPLAVIASDTTGVRRRFAAEVM